LVGKWGEQLARDYLISHGYTVMEGDKRMGHSDIDIIAVKDTKICFVEVKTRTSPDVDPAEAITPQKMRRMARAADSYLQTYNSPLTPQFDVILINGSAEGYTLEHIPDAFPPPLQAL
ncbi:MAG: YraN family protein, partial [Muribaculaceae bacterium]|nr:YraN family protein [Muribaculaceae bacterium]